MRHDLFRFKATFAVCGTFLLCLFWGRFHAAGSEEDGADRHVLALWLFDETAYPNVTLTDWAATPLR